MAFPMSEKELSGLVIVKVGHRIIFFLVGGDCILLHLSYTGDISCDIGRWWIDVTVKCN